MATVVHRVLATWANSTGGDLADLCTINSDDGQDDVDASQRVSDKPRGPPGTDANARPCFVRNQQNCLGGGPGAVAIHLVWDMHDAVVCIFSCRSVLIG